MKKHVIIYSIALGVVGILFSLISLIVMALSAAFNGESDSSFYSLFLATFPIILVIIILSFFHPKYNLIQALLVAVCGTLYLIPVFTTPQNGFIFLIPLLLFYIYAGVLFKKVNIKNRKIQ